MEKFKTHTEHDEWKKQTLKSKWIEVNKYMDYKEDKLQQNGTWVGKIITIFIKREIKEQNKEMRLSHLNGIVKLLKEWTCLLED